MAKIENGSGPSELAAELRKVERPAAEKAQRWLLKEGLTSPLFGPAMKLGQLLRPLLPLWSGQIDTLQAQLQSGVDELLASFAQIVALQDQLSAQIAGQSAGQPDPRAEAAPRPARVGGRRHPQRAAEGLEHRLALVVGVVALQVVDVQRHLLTKHDQFGIYLQELHRLSIGLLL